MDMGVLRAMLDQKASLNDVDSVHRMNDRLLKELEVKCGARELESHIGFCKAVFEDLNKELQLKANIKDLITLMD